MHWRRNAIQDGPETHPTWYALTTPPQRERSAREFLRSRDVYAFYPSEERKTKRNGVWRSREAPIVGGYVFARFTQRPQWHVLFDKPYFSGVISVGVWPYPMQRAVIRRLQGLTVEAEELRQAHAATREAVRRALTPRQGEPARLTTGALAGHLVDVTSIHGGIAAFILPGGARATADISSLQREGVDLTTIPGYLDVQPPTGTDFG